MKRISNEQTVDDLEFGLEIPWVWTRNSAGNFGRKKKKKTQWHRTGNQGHSTPFDGAPDGERTVHTAPSGAHTSTQKSGGGSAHHEKKTSA
jgi:hypothetical protein